MLQKRKRKKKVVETQQEISKFFQYINQYGINTHIVS